MTEHTKGPWHVGGTWSMGNRGETTQTTVIYSDDCIPLVQTCWGEGYRGKKESEANAHLVAAAPELLEALEDIVDQWQKTRMRVPADLSDSIRVFGQKAIRKAKGESA